MFPLWLFTDGWKSLSYEIPETRLIYLFFLNGSSNFAQNVLAFNILAIVSPVTYSIASLIKRIFIISVSIIYFRDPVSLIQGWGMAITFLGLYLYNETKGDVARKERKVMEIQDGLLPTSSSFKPFI
jgi:drug/metabolite transporter (DMT)-like permease